ncbi:MAG: hypothetical protein DRH04_06130 [Deltaproteobacteria bacterium]|nr:MAG: hypothetical protein DRH04_06130 [Deltaproteobacteria bacterium]
MTYEDIYNRTREILGDSAGNRYTDAGLEKLVANAVNRVLSWRPDLRSPEGFGPVSDPSEKTDPVPLDELAREPVSYILAAEALISDTEDAANAQTAQTFINTAKFMLGQ